VKFRNLEISQLLMRSPTARGILLGPAIEGGREWTRLESFAGALQRLRHITRRQLFIQLLLFTLFPPVLTWGAKITDSEMIKTSTANICGPVPICGPMPTTKSLLAVRLTVVQDMFHFVFAAVHAELPTTFRRPCLHSPTTLSSGVP
jgi:hypothetical protein